MVNYHLLSTTAILQSTNDILLSKKAVDRYFLVICYGFPAFD